MPTAKMVSHTEFYKGRTIRKVSQSAIIIPNYKLKNKKINTEW